MVTEACVILVVCPPFWETVTYIHLFPYKETHSFGFIQFPSFIAQLRNLVAHHVGNMYASLIILCVMVGGWGSSTCCPLPSHKGDASRSCTTYNSICRGSLKRRFANTSVAGES